MDNGENKEKFDKQTGALYEAFGRFVIEFEQMCERLRVCIIFSVNTNGQHGQQFLQVLLADLTAYPLITKLRAILSIIYKDDEQQRNHLDPLFKFCIELNELRNDIVHGTWTIGSTRVEEIEFDTAWGRKAKLTKKGLEPKLFSYKPEKVNALTEKIKIATELIFRLQYCTSYGAMPTKNLEIKEIEKLKGTL